ncbi:hypothetical protein vseg_006638 [Gypsophila vaccaria]
MAEHRSNEMINDTDDDNKISTVDDAAGETAGCTNTTARGFTDLAGVGGGCGDDVDAGESDGFTTMAAACGVTVTGDGGGDDDVDVDVDAGGSAGLGTTAARGVTGGGGGLAERLSEILRGREGGDLLMQQSERESNFLQWLQALDWQVIGACRADERLKPLLKLNAVDAAEDRLLAHLSQHFEASEVGMLARCLCVPLVSMRVGKVVKQGSLLCPTNLRGTLNLTLLPSSDLRLSFVGDNGQTERLATLSDDAEFFTVTIEKIPADLSGRSFLVKIHGDTFYFWCSERSELLGIDLLSKMDDFLKRKPTLDELTGISKSRLESFASHLRAYLVGPTASSIHASTIEQGESSSTSGRSLRTRQNGCQVSRGNSQFQGILSPRPSSFKEGLPKSLSALRNISRDKLRRRGDLHLAAVDRSSVSEPFPNISEKDKLLVPAGSSSASPLGLLENLGDTTFPPPPSATLPLPPISSLFSPYYCWCPPCTAPSIAPLGKLSTSFSEPFSLPPLSTLLPATVDTGFLPIPPLDLPSVPPFELPALLSDPLVRLPFTKQCSQPIPTFTPLMCDPIVHLPVLDICSLGQSYLVSAGPGMTTTIPPLHSNLMGPIIPEGESLLEKGARETLRLLIASSGGQPSGSFIGVLPSVLSNENDPGVVVTGSRGLYSGISDVDAMVSSFAAVGLSSMSERSMRISNLQNYSTTTAPDAIEQTSCGPDLQNSTFMSREDEED